MKKEVVVDQGLMTQRTYDILKAKLEDLKQQIKKNQTDSGETFDSAQDWHDNGAYDMLQQELQILITQHDTIKRRLNEAKIIEPRTETDVVGIGNTVVVRYLDEDESEKFTILGVADTETQKDWISAASPLGAALLDKKEGETVTIPPNIQVALLHILAGEF